MESALSGPGHTIIYQVRNVCASITSVLRFPTLRILVAHWRDEQPAIKFLCWHHQKLLSVNVVRGTGTQPEHNVL